MSQICTAAYVHDIVQGIGGLTEGVAVQCSRGRDSRDLAFATRRSGTHP
ncbi:hypothetical protein [Serratia symbiotica]|nr:hypothetical protein [Serratia symbiotica]MBQ0956896.1 hypothetical protein [Serratia symbiotica]